MVPNIVARLPDFPALPVYPLGIQVPGQYGDIHLQSIANDQVKLKVKVMCNVKLIKTSNT